MTYKEKIEVQFKSKYFYEVIDIAEKADREIEKLTELLIEFGDILGGQHRHKLNNLLEENTQTRGIKMIEIKRIENCKLEIPMKGTEFSAGYDLSSNEKFFELFPRKKKLVDSGFAWKIPKGYVGIIKPRSGLAHKHGIDILAGVIDSDYTGEVKIIMQNHGNRVFTVNHGERIAQMVIIKIHDDNRLAEVSSFEKTVRGGSGFGSTGIN